MAITTTTQMPAAVQQTLGRRLLSVKVPYLIHTLPAEKSSLPRGGGRFKRFRRYSKLDTATVPLGNSGVTPAGQQLSSVDKFYVHVKSSLIDLETLRGDRAQAAFAAA